MKTRAPLPVETWHAASPHCINLLKPAPYKAFTSPPQLIKFQTVTCFYTFCSNRKKNDAANRPIFSIHGKNSVNGRGQSCNVRTKSVVYGTFSTNLGTNCTNAGIKSVNRRVNLSHFTEIYPAFTENLSFVGQNTTVVHTFYADVRTFYWSFYRILSILNINFRSYVK